MSAKRDDNVFLGHMLDMARKACSKCTGLRRAQFDADENLRLALFHLVQIIGEAARSVSAETRNAHPEI
ncbi:MAG: HepT-like ribonuclease domain-containing protein, partial [Planctomycetota bacterium]